jgi:hypothetical protein
MMSASATAHVAAAMSTAAFDLNERAVLHGCGAGRCNSQPRGSRHRHRNRRSEYRGSDQ